ncbi:uncharacterized protein LOC106876884 [Octopus bimaculoides]|uniref:uncharacterized protein LOC106876884 n=1 Tax=Octopus bimaculoides TaxID=37653 RepID=UPI00071C5D90|nr:uncharacterized protein LOC106876884 [Octopus bimaculoides]|eukprot:XP_014781114.1 PREDICTED: uncharacterized protein LOC106876884 [Octopus bimaculoides]
MASLSWKIRLSCNDQHLTAVTINKGIFKGESSSPLLFVIVLIPLSVVLRKIKEYYELRKNGPHLSHLLFMDDLKLFAKTEPEKERLVETVRMCSKDIGMEFGISKCEVLTLERGKRELPNGEIMEDQDDDGYQHLGILELGNILHKEMKDKFIAAYFKRFKLLLKSKLNSRNHVTAISIWDVASHVSVYVRRLIMVLDAIEEVVNSMLEKYEPMAEGINPDKSVDLLLDIWRIKSMSSGGLVGSDRQGDRNWDEEMSRVASLD